MDLTQAESANLARKRLWNGAAPGNRVAPVGLRTVELNRSLVANLDRLLPYALTRVVNGQLVFLATTSREALCP